MTIHAYRNAALSALGVTAFACAAPAFAAGTDYLLKLGGVDGESKDPKAQSADSDKHKGWIELESVQLGTARATGGVNVASGDVNGDGAAAASGQATGRRTYEPIVIHKRIDKSTPAPAADKKIAASDDDQTAALLVPAIQKVREAAMRTPAWEGCAAGQKIEGLAIKQKTTGRTGRILDATVATCATESVSFNFTKIEWK
jgi:type VI protein secretion system component Hcp